MDPEVQTSEQERALKPMDEFTECSNGCPQMVVIPSGKFMMGSADGTGNDDEYPQHEVVIGARLTVSRFEITVAERQSCVTGKPYRLLSESEWEYAARAGTATTYSFGDDETLLGRHAWYAGDRIRLAGQKTPNDFSLYDMHGNALNGWRIVTIKLRWSAAKTARRGQVVAVTVSCGEGDGATLQ